MGSRYNPPSNTDDPQPPATETVSMIGPPTSAQAYYRHGRDALQPNTGDYHQFMSMQAEQQQQQRKYPSYSPATTSFAPQQSSPVAASAGGRSFQFDTAYIHHHPAAYDQQHYYWETQQQLQPDEAGAFRQSLYPSEPASTGSPQTTSTPASTSPSIVWPDEQTIATFGSTSAAATAAPTAAPTVAQAQTSGSSTIPAPSPSLAQRVPPPPQRQQTQQQQQLRLGIPPLPSTTSTMITSPLTSTRQAANRKRQRKQENSIASPESGEESDSEDDGLQLTPRSKHRLPGACTHCKKLKMKCEFPKNSSDNTCKRCKTGGHACIVEGRKPRIAPNKREYLLTQIRQKDAVIESLLNQLHNPYSATPLSIASFQTAYSSPAEYAVDASVGPWLEKLQTSASRKAQLAQQSPALSTLTADAGSASEDDLRTNSSSVEDEVTARERERDTLHSLPDSTVPLGLIASLSLNDAPNDAQVPSNLDIRRAAPDNTGGSSVLDDGSTKDDDVGVASKRYFQPRSTDLDQRMALIHRSAPPEILVHGLVSAEDVERLFAIFFERVNPYLSLLDTVLHTPARTFARCPFLFTVICAISCRYYPDKAAIYPIAMHFAKHAAASALIEGWKTVELCQAYILMAVYAVPARRWEEDRSWLYVGLAARIATDLNLHHLPPSPLKHDEIREREMLNRTRVWMICFNLDRSTATQFGKPSTIKEDYVVRHSQDWYKRSKYNHPYDVHLCAYQELLRIVARFHDKVFSDSEAPSGLNEALDFRDITLRADAELREFEAETRRRFDADSKRDDPACMFRSSLLPFLVNYSRLVMASFGFQQAYRRGLVQADALYFNMCFESASAVIKVMIDSLAPSGYLRYAPDGHFVFASFASAFLLKLLRPDLRFLLNRQLENQIVALIQQLVNVLASPEVAIDDRHTPKLYAKFLDGLLSRHRADASRPDALTAPRNPPESSSTDVYGAGPGSDQSGGQQYLPLYHEHGASSHTSPHMHGPGSTNTRNMSDSQNLAEFTSASGYEGAPSPVQDTDAQTSDGDMLAAMQAIRDPSWWQNFLMPGFDWPPDTAVPQVQNHLPYSYHNMNTLGSQNPVPLPPVGWT